MTLTPIVLKVNTFCSPSNKHLYHNVNTNPQTINGIDNSCCQLVLIVIRCYAAAKLPYQCHALLVTGQIVYKPHHTKLFRANPTNQDNLSASINPRKKKGISGWRKRFWKSSWGFLHNVWPRKQGGWLLWQRFWRSDCKFCWNWDSLLKMQFFFPFQIAATQTLKGRLRRSGAGYTFFSYSARLANPYRRVKGNYTIVGIGLGISRLDIHDRVGHACFSPLSFRHRPRRNRLSWHRLWGNNYWQNIASEPPLSPKNKHHVNSFER